MRRPARSLTDAEVDALFDEISGLSLKPLLDRAVRGTKDLPLAEAFDKLAVAMTPISKPAKPSLEVRTRKEGSDCKLASVHEDGAAHHAGLSAGDALVAIDGLRVTASNLDALLARYRIGDTVSVHAFRRDELMRFSVTLKADSAQQYVIEPRDKPLAGAKLRKAWLKVRG